MDINFYVLIIIAWLIFYTAVYAARKANAVSTEIKPNTRLITSPLKNELERALEGIFNILRKPSVIPVQSQAARSASIMQLQNRKAYTDWGNKYI